MGKQSWKPGNMLNPVPAVMVSVADEAHRPNIITVAWAGTICTNPPMVSISVRPSRYSYDIIEKTGEFVINLTTEKLARACDYCGVVSGRDVDKFAKTGLTPMPVEHVSAPAIAESPVNIACRVTESRALGSHTMFIAEVVGVTVDVLPQGAEKDHFGEHSVHSARRTQLPARGKLLQGAYPRA